MEDKSLWTELKYIKDSPVLNDNKVVDILIIGGGIAGLTTAYNLKDSGLNIMLVDANKVGYGVTSRTTGKLTYLQETVYSKIKKIYNEDIAKLYLDSQRAAISFVVDTVNKENIKCDLKMTYSYVYGNNNMKMANIKKEEQLLKKWHINVNNTAIIPLPLSSKYAIYVKDTYDFHSVKYCNGLKKNISKTINIYEFSRVTEIDKNNDKYEAIINGRTVIANKVIITCHYPFFINPEFIPFKTYLEKSYLSASLVTKSERISAITDGAPYFSARYYQDNKDNYILFLSNAHLLGNKINSQNNFQKHLNNLKQKLNLGYNYVWFNFDIMTFDHLPYIGKVDQENIYMATGFNTWGMTNGTIAGMLLADLVTGKNNKYEQLFSLKRKIIINKFMINGIGSIFTFAKSKLISKNKAARVKIKNINGQKTGVYIDEFNNKHYVKLTCPHFKCGLTFNQVAKTWDCPCHGSRFDIDGNIVKGPSTKCISTINK